MNKTELENLIFEIDYGMQYMVKSLAKTDGNFASPLLSTAYGNMLQAKEALILVVNPGCYKESDMPESAFIEDAEYIIGSDMVSYDHRIEKYMHIKYLRDGTASIIEKLELYSDKPELYPVLYSIINSYIWLRQELLKLKKSHPAKHSEPMTEADKEVIKTKKLVEKRLTKKYKS